MRKPIRVVWGIALVILGVIGLIMPIMPGWVFLIPGLIILADHFPWAHRLLEWAKSKAPHFHRDKQPPPSDRRS